MSRPCSRLLCLAILIGLAPGLTASAAASDSYLAHLITDARALEFADQRQWYLLLHYRRSWLGEFKSQADGGEFFFAEDGKRSPRAELKVFFQSAPADSTRQHPQCQFPARYDWLRRQLNFDPTQLHEHPCDRFNGWRSRLDLGSATLIFADAYLDNPPSMYGHTFLRLNKKDHRGAEHLLDYVVNYSADTETDSGIVFAAKGVFGGYPGRFSTTPFYILSLTKGQIDRMIMYLWELGSTYFDYFFLTEKYSYQLLPLLEIADPSLHLTDGFWPWVIPIDTIKVLREQHGLITGTSFRLCHLSKMLHKRAQLSEDEVAAAEASSLRMDEQAEVMLDRFSIPQQGQILDAAYDYYRYREGFSMDRFAENKKLERRILLRRRQLGV